MCFGSGSPAQQTTQQQATYTPNPSIVAAGNQAIHGAQSAAATPFGIGVQPIAGFSPQQQQAFQQYGQLQGLYQPYYNTASNLMQQSAQGPHVNQFMNPYAHYVMANLGEQQGQQMQQLTGQSTQTAGGVGADRIGVAQGELARQQGLASGQTLAGIYGSALGAAQQQQQLEQAAGYGMGQLGGANLQSALAATGALYGSGAYQQQLNQAQLNAQYQNDLMRQAYQFQAPQYLANITGGLAGAMGATTGQYGMGTYQPPQPSTFSQVAGLGLAGAGAYGALNQAGVVGSNPSYGGGSMLAGDAFGGSAGSPLSGLSASDYGARGGRFFADGGGTDDNTDSYYSDIQPPAKDITAKDVALAGKGKTDWMSSDSAVPSGQTQRVLSAQQALNAPQIAPMQMPQQSSGSSGGFGEILGDVAKIAPLFAALARGGRSPYPPAFQDGGDVNFADRFGAVGSLDARWPDDPATTFNERSMAAYPGARDPEFEAKQRLSRGIMDRDQAANVDFEIGKEKIRRGQGTSWGGDDPGSVWMPAGSRGTPLPPKPDDPNQPTIPEGQSGSTSNPYRQPDANAKRALVDIPLPSPTEHTGPNAPGERIRIPNQPQVRGNPQIASADPTALPSWREVQAANQKELQNWQVPYPMSTHDTSTDIARSPWLALMMGGAKMASTYGPPGVSLGAGFGAAGQTLEKQRQDAQQEESLNQRARQLQMEALKYTNMTPAEAARLGLEQARMEEGKWLHGEVNPVTGEQTFFNPYTNESYTVGPNGIKKGGGDGAGIAGAGTAGTVTPPPIPAPPANTPSPPAQTAISPTGGTVTDTDPDKMVAPGAVNDAEENPQATSGITTKGAAAAARAAFAPEQKEINKAAIGADTSQFRLKEMKRDLNTIMAYVNKTPSGPAERALQFAMRPGPGAGNAVQMANWLSRFGTGVPPDVLAAAQTWAKNSTLAGFRGVVGEGLSAKEAQPIIQASMGAVASMNLPESSSRALIASGEQLAQRAKDKQTFMNSYMGKNHQFGAGWEDQFEQKHPIGSYIARAVVSALPPEERAKLGVDTKQLRLRRDEYMKAEKAGNDAETSKARDNYTRARNGFNRKYGGTADYFAFGAM